MRQALRGPLLKIHRWTGLTVGMLLLFLALTGLGLEFREQLHGPLEPTLHNAGACRSALPLDAQMASARAAHPTGRWDTVILYPRDNAPTLMRFGDDTQLYVDACDGRVLASQARWGGIFGRLEQLHRFRFLESGEVANAFTGGTAIALAIVFVGGGLALWWPSAPRRITSSMSWRANLRGRAFDLSVHRLAGVYACVLLLGVALTALPLAFTSVRTFLDVVTGSPLPQKKPHSTFAGPEKKALPLARVWQIAAPGFTDPEKVVISAAHKNKDPVEIYAIERGAPHDEARSYAFFDAFDGHLLRSEPWATSSLGNRAYRTAGAIHAGEYGLVLQILELLGTLAVPVLAFTGVRSWLRSRKQRQADASRFQVRVRAVNQESRDVKSFELIATDGRMLPAFDAGAHVEVQVRPGIVRCYSLCSDPADRRRWVIGVKRASASRGGSQALHEMVRAGDLLTVSPPRNHFPLVLRGRHHVLFGAGIGITPLLAMVHALQRRGASWELHLLARDVSDVPFRTRLESADLEGRMHVHLALGDPGLRALCAGLAAVRRPETYLYLCGPGRFMEAVTQAVAPSWPADTIRAERFDGDAEALSRPRLPFEAELLRSGRTISVPSDRTLLDVLHAHGIDVQTSCGEGVCGSCATTVLAGGCDHRDAFLTSAERAAGDRILPCVSRAQGPRLVLDL